MIVDKLIAKIDSLNNPSVVGLDTDTAFLPQNLSKLCTSLYSAAQAVKEFNFGIIDAICKIVPSVKLQSAYYEKLGYEGVKCFAETAQYAKSQGMIVIADAKRGDIGSTAAAYSAAFLSGGNNQPFECDFLTVNAYMGGDGIAAFVDDCKKNDKGIFALVKTSNASSGDLQDLKFADGTTVYQKMAELVSKWGSSSIGNNGYSRVGAVVGATYPKQATELRKIMPHTFFLVPGYGAQGGSAADAAAAFDDSGKGAIVNSSRGIICAYKQPQYSGLDYKQAAQQATVDMREQLIKALKSR